MYTVVIVEDEELTKKSLKKMVESSPWHYTVVGEASNGIEALEQVNDCCPDVIITDICMPLMDGIELMEKLRSLGCTSEIIVLSGYGEFEYARSAIRHRVYEYWLKPLNTDTVLQTLQSLSNLLEQQRMEKHHRGDWLKTARTYSGQFAEAVWYSDEGKLRSLLREWEGLFTDCNVPEIVAAKYADLCAMIEQDLSLLDAETGTRIRTLMKTVRIEGSSVHKRLADELLQLLSEIRDTRSNGYAYITCALEYIHKHYVDESLSLLTAAEYVGLSASHLSHTFKTHMKVPFIQYLTQYRMEQAKKLITDPNLKTYSIAQMVGYREYPHFSRTFKKTVGISVSDYRKRLGIREHSAQNGPPPDQGLTH